jgi:hypothetical protein
MKARHDPELEQLKRSVDMIEYAKQAGYRTKEHHSSNGLTVMEHPNQDRIVVARAPDGAWIYAGVSDYRPKDRDEKSEVALARLRGAIVRSPDKGSIVEFVQSRDWVTRHAEPSLEGVRQHLRDFRLTGVLDAERTPEIEQRLRRWREAQATIDERLGGSREVSPRTPSAGPAVPPPTSAPVGPASTLGPKSPSDLHRRRYDWTPTPQGVEAILRGARKGSPDRGR